LWQVEWHGLRFDSSLFLWLPSLWWIVNLVLIGNGGVFPAMFNPVGCVTSSNVSNGFLQKQHLVINPKCTIITRNRRSSERELFRMLIVVPTQVYVYSFSWE
jgi:hypothetical protein